MRQCTGGGRGMSRLDRWSTGDPARAGAGARLRRPQPPRALAAGIATAARARKGMAATVPYHSLVAPNAPFPGDPGPLPRGLRMIQFIARQPSWVFKLAASTALLVFAAVLALLLVPAALVAGVIFVAAAGVLGGGGGGGGGAAEPPGAGARPGGGEGPPG